MSWILIIMVIGGGGTFAISAVPNFTTRAKCDSAAAFAELAIRRDAKVKSYCIIAEMEVK